MYRYVCRYRYPMCVGIGRYVGRYNNIISLFIRTLKYNAVHKYTVLRWI